MKYKDFVRKEILRQAQLMEEDVEKIIDVVLTEGCESGAIASIIYVDDCLKIFEDYKEEINDILAQSACEGLAIHEHPQFDKSDPLVLYAPNKILCLYASFEKIATEILEDQND